VNRIEVHADGKAVSFKCPGCQHWHRTPIGPVDGTGRNWQWNGDAERPTLQPSILATAGCYADSTWCQGENAEYCDRNKPADADGFAHCMRCHSFVADGRIRFLTDSTHALAGQTVDLPPVA
jgi:hypothetical protein